MLRETLLSCSFALGCAGGPCPVPYSHQDRDVAIGIVGSTPGQRAGGALGCCPLPRQQLPPPAHLS